MRLIRLHVIGEYGCDYQFEKTNVILGDNNTGKSTFLKLILYCLGSPIKSFIEEISKKNLCDSVALDIEFKSGKQVRVLRKLPVSDAIIVTPIKTASELVNDEINAFSTAEFSDFLLENEGYSLEKISYSKDRYATFRFYFLLRALYVDQDTAAQSILSDLDMGADYFTSQPIIKKSIIEKLLGKDNSELQRIRLEIQSLTKLQTELSERISFLSEEKDELEKNHMISANSVEKELSEIKAEKQILSSKEYEKIASIQALNDHKYSESQLKSQARIKKLYEMHQQETLELQDIEEVIKSLSSELAFLKYQIVARDILERLPILFCPNCLSPISEEDIKKGLCSNCSKKTIEEKVLNNAMLKKTISDSISEAKELEQLKKNNIASIKNEIASLQDSLAEEKRAVLSRSEEERNILFELINSIKVRLEYLLKRENILNTYCDISHQLSGAKSERKDNTERITVLKEQLLQADNTASLSMENYSVFKKNFSTYLQAMFEEVAICELDENYMPVIDSTKMTSVASASLKVAVRLSYVLALLNEENTNDKRYSHLGFLLLDSPKDKDLDNNRFEKYLEIIDSGCQGQVIITGSISDEDLYRRGLKNATYFEPLRTSSKLLKRMKKDNCGQ